MVPVDSLVMEIGLKIDTTKEIKVCQLDELVLDLGCVSIIYSNDFDYYTAVNKFEDKT